MIFAASGVANDPTGVFLQYGVVGALCVILGMFAWAAYRRERDRADRLEAQLQVINDRIIERFADVLKESSDALAKTGDYLRGLDRWRRE